MTEKPEGYGTIAWCSAQEAKRRGEAKAAPPPPPVVEDKATPATAVERVIATVKPGKKG